MTEPELIFNNPNNLENKKENKREIIRVDEKPKSKYWFYNTLYKTNARGTLDQWTIGCDEENMQIIMEWGKVGGIIQTSKTEIVINSLNRSVRDQGLIETRSRYTNKIDKECYYLMGEKPKFKQFFMLSNLYKDKKNKTKKLNFPVMVQPKLDGIRIKGVYDPEEGQVLLSTRSNKDVKFLSHIKEELIVFFRYLPAGSILDGEVYNHDYNFNTIQSIVTRSVNVNEMEKTLKYYIYDICTQDDYIFKERYNLLSRCKQLYSEDNNQNLYFELLKGKIAENESQIYKHYESYLQQNYEGVIIIKLVNDLNNEKQVKDSKYLHSRCDNKLKLKPYFDEEGIVVGVDSAKGTEKEAAMLLIKDEYGITTRMRCACDIETRKKWLLDPKKVIGKQFTFKHEGRTPDNHPRFPVALHERNE